jgi:hypothetical protein
MTREAPERRPGRQDRPLFDVASHGDPNPNMNGVIRRPRRGDFQAGTAMRGCLR